MTTQEAIAAALSEAINDHADIRLPDGRLAIAREHAIEVIRAALANTGMSIAQPVPALDVERLADAEHRWCVEVEGEFALGHSPDSHRRQATFILARLSGDPA